MRLLLLFLLLAAPLSAQVRLTGLLDGGVVVPMGDLGAVSSPSPYVAVGVRVPVPESRVTFGLELNYTRARFDSLPRWNEQDAVWTRIEGPSWQSYGAMARLEYAVINGLYAIGGVGILRRERSFDEDPNIADPLKTSDPASQAGAGYRIGPWLTTELRLVNVFTVQNSERWILLTVGARF